MRHVGAIAGRELGSLFVSPVAYAVMALFTVLAGAFFLSQVLQFQEYVVRLQAFQAMEQLEQLNLNDQVIAPFLYTMSVVLMFLIPGITMGLFASEKANGTQELLLTSPITIWELVLGKFLAAAAFIAILVLLLAPFPAILFTYGDPEIGKTAAGLAGLLLVGLVYVAIGAFASSLTRNPLIAFVVSIVMLLVLLIIGFLADLGAAGAGAASTSVGDTLRWLSTAPHLEGMMMGLIDTKDLAYFGVMTIAFLVLAKTSVESVRWR